MNELEDIRTQMQDDIEGRERRRLERVRELKAELQTLEIGDTAYLQQKLRASQPLPPGAKCPQCWILDGRVIDLKAIGGGTPDADLFQCPECKIEIEARS